MKKIFYFVYTVSLIYIIFLSFLDYSNKNCKNIEENKIPVIINLPNHLSNIEFISALDENAKKLNTDILYLITDNSKEKVRKLYYTTTNTDNFLPVPNMKGIFEKYNYITSQFDSEPDTYPLIGSNFFNEVYIYDFSKIKDYNLLSCTYYLDADKCRDFTELLTRQGFHVKIVNNKNLTRGFLSIRSLILPITLLFVSTIFYILARRKEIVAKRLLGYSKFILVLENLVECMLRILILTSIIIIANVAILNFIYKGCFVDYFLFLLPRAAYLILFVFINIFVLNVLNLLQKSNQYLKGKDDNYNLYAISLILKAVFSFLLLLNLSYIILEVNNIYHINKINSNISKTIAPYVSLPVNGSTTIIDSSNQLEYNRHLDLFYEDTVNKYEGILINTRNYRNINLSNDDSLAQEYKQISITVNENYLKLNPIQDVYGRIIDSSQFDKNKINLLLPEGMDEKKVKEKYIYSYDVEENNIKCIYYKKDELIRSFNPYSGRWNDGLINNPIIEIYDKIFLRIKCLIMYLDSIIY